MIEQSPRRLNSKRLVLRILLGTTLAAASFSWGQEVDPFYLKLLGTGEKSFLAKNYEQAIQELDIAAFGLTNNKDLAAKAHVYLCLSHFRLKNEADSKKHLMTAMGLIGREALARLDINETVKPDLEKLVQAYRLAEAPPPEAKKQTPAPKPESVPLIPSPPVPTEKEIPAADKVKLAGRAVAIRDWEKLIKYNPRQSEPYFELASLYMQEGDLKKAEETLTNLLKNNPSEIRGYLELGRLEYRARSLKNAEKNLEKFLAYSGNIAQDAPSLREAKALLILSSDDRGDSQKVQKLLPSSQDIFQAEALDSLPLGPEDKERLRKLWTTYGKK